MIPFIIFLIAAGLVLAYAPMEPKIKNFVTWVVIVLAVIWLVGIIFR